ncbi:hypothetical protein PYCC9005_000762 [Savitreella phatthalungensis]
MLTRQFIRKASSSSTALKGITQPTARMQFYGRQPERFSPVMHSGTGSHGGIAIYAALLGVETIALLSIMALAKKEE